MNTEEGLLRRIEGLEKELQFYHDFDHLTGLYNKHSFYQQIKTLLHVHRDMDYCIVTIDIEHFKLVNDFYGLPQGNKLLCFLADILKAQFSFEDTCVATMGADVFMVMLPKQRHALMEQLPHLLDGYPLDMDLTLAIGVYAIEERDTEPSLMCDRSSIAANSVKGSYTAHIAWYDDSMRNILVEEQELLNGVEKSLLNKEFEVYIQPKCNMRTNQIVGAEALVRWNHPQKGMIPPKDFIPVFEKNGFIKQLDHYVWEECARILHDWIASGHEAIPISVNISRNDIFAMDICEVFQTLITKYELDSKLLELEITESAYSVRTDEIINVINRLMQKGFTVLMDDFGSGYSSLNILKDISIDVLKLDMRFLDNDNQKSKDILESVVHMAKWLNLKVIAEGVENREQVDFLLGIGCNFAQGYYFYRPMPYKQFQELLLQTDKVDFKNTYLTGSMVEWIRFKDLFYGDFMSEQMLNNILGSVALYSYDGDTMMTMRGNEAYFRMMGLGIEEYENGMDTFRNLSAVNIKLLVDAVKEAKRNRYLGSEVLLERIHANKERIWINMRIFFLSDTNGKEIYFASITDMTSFMNIVKDLRLSQESFQIAMEYTKGTIFEVDIKTHIATFSVKCMEAFGLQNTTAQAPEGFIEQGSICQGYEDILRDVYRAMYRGENQASCVIKSHMADGQDVWNRITLRAIKDENGESMKAVGIVENINKEMALKQP